LKDAGFEFCSPEGIGLVLARQGRLGAGVGGLADFMLALASL